MSDINKYLYPEKYGKTQCPHCNGYGSSLKDDHNGICNYCNGTGLVSKEDKEKYKDKKL